MTKRPETRATLGATGMTKKTGGSGCTWRNGYDKKRPEARATLGATGMTKKDRRLGLHLAQRV
ncbi:hypothetical protein [Paenibacillus sp. GCM10012306]|uniref:hypothetical protein n=1 Tax=Paenibacillus sp. GCM10012306 TaxID=3317342 RepID=UPI00360907A3